MRRSVVGDGPDQLEFFSHEAPENFSRSGNFAGGGGGAALGRGGEKDSAAGGAGRAGGDEEVEVEDVAVDELFCGDVGG